MTSLDYYLRGAIRAKCYVVKISVTPSETVDALKDNICEAIGEIQLHTVDNVLKNFSDTVGYFMSSRGSYLNEILFLY